jgi:hypothetical protein
MALRIDQERQSRWLSGASPELHGGSFAILLATAPAQAQDIEENGLAAELLVGPACGHRGAFWAAKVQGAFGQSVLSREFRLQIVSAISCMPIPRRADNPGSRRAPQTRCVEDARWTEPS